MPKASFGSIPPAFKSVEFRKISPELLKKAEQNVETWRASFDTVLGDLDKVEAEEGVRLLVGDPRRAIVDLCAMRLDQAKEDLAELMAN